MHKRGRIGLVRILLVVGAFLISSCRFFGRVTVPELRNNTLEGAKVITERLGLMLEVGEEVECEVSPGLICRQHPLPGSVVRRGSKVVVSVSKGPAKKPVPDLTGLSVSEASALLYEGGMRVGELEYRYSDEVGEGRVIESNPPTGAELAPGSPVNLVLSRGPEPKVTVPNLVGRRLSVARSLLKDRGLVVGDISHQVSTEFYAGTVIRQNPRAGAEVPKGSSVSLVVATVLR